MADFESLLSSLASLLGDDTPQATGAGVKNALFGYPGAAKVADALDPSPTVTNRASMIPIGNYSDGSVGLAWPQSAVDAKNALGRLGRSVDAAAGAPWSPAETFPRPEDAVLPGLAMTGGIAIPKPMGTVGMFGGRMARTADHAALAKAEDLAAKGAPREQIWNETGWFKGADDKWRFEIDDSAARQSKLFTDGGLGRVLKHNELYDAYPDVAGIPVEKTQGAASFVGSAGYTSRGDGLFGGLRKPERIYASPIIDALDPEGKTSRMLHEAQHAIQKREGFARGANEREYSYRDGLREKSPRYDTARAAVEPYAEALMRQDGVEAPPRERYSTIRNDYEGRALRELNQLAYARSAGEIEANNVEQRRAMTMQQRRQTPPWLTQELPDERQLLQQWGELSPAPSRQDVAAAPPARSQAAEAPRAAPGAPVRDLRDAIGRLVDTVGHNGPINVTTKNEGGYRTTVVYPSGGGFLNKRSGPELGVIRERPDGTFDWAGGLDPEVVAAAANREIPIAPRSGEVLPPARVATNQQPPRIPPTIDESGSTLFSNPKEGAPAGLLATSGLERMQADDALPKTGAQSIYDLPPSSQFIPETRARILEDNRKGPPDWRADPRRTAGMALDQFQGNTVLAQDYLLRTADAMERKGQVSDAALLRSAAEHAVDTRSAIRRDTSGDAYAKQLETMLAMEPDGTTLHANPSSPAGLIPMAGGGGDNSFEGRLAELQALLGEEPQQQPANALTAKAANALMAQQRPSDRLQERGYLDTLPPSVERYDQPPAGADAYMRAFNAKAQQLKAQGVPPEKAIEMLQQDPALNELWRRSLQK